MNRRTLLATGATVGTATWIAPSVLSLDHVAAAAASGTHESPTVTDGAVLITPPASNPEGAPILDSNDNTFVWVEAGPVTLTSALTVNRVTAGSFNGNSNEAATISSGTTVCSYFVHGDRLDDSGRLTGTMTFGSAQILGLIYESAEFNASSFLEASGTTYSYGPMEGNDQMSLDLTPGANSVSWNMRFGPALDQIRVITTCV